MSIDRVLYIVYCCCGILVCLIPAVVGFIRAAINKKKAKTAEEKAEAEKLMAEKANELIESAETFYKNLDSVLKQTTGESAGPLKKDSVMAKLQAFALSKGITFDAEYWSSKIDEIVKLTKAVN